MFQIGLLLLFLVISNEGRRLDRHVHHYEPLHYDADTLMRQHYRLMRHSTDLYDRRRDDHIKLSFRTHGRHFDLRLRPDDSTYLHKDFELIVDGEPQSRTLLKSVSYIGHDVNDPHHTEVHGNLAFGVFDGSIHTKDDIYHIEPATRYFKNHNDFKNNTGEKFHSVAYRHSNVHLETRHNKRVTPSSHRHSTCGIADDAKRRFLARVVSSAESNGDSSHHSSRLKKRQSSGTRNPNKVSCWINVVVDNFFYEDVTPGTDQATRVVQASAIIRNIVAGASLIFKRVDFDSNSVADGINFAIQKMTINTTQGSGSFGNRYLGVESLLNTFSENDWGSFCLSYLFTNRDFANGVLGLAFVGDESNRGGICDGYSNRKTLNTGVVTMVNYERRVSNAAAMLTFAHETGHNFGSEHDTGDCSPQNNGYIMTAYANDGTKSNNNRFSPCSISVMNTIIGLRGQLQDGCFRLNTDLCGNYLLDDGEDCDCGVDYNDNTKLCNDDPCCDGSTCRIANRTGHVCSPQSSGCCFANCTVIPQSANHICFTETDCSYNQTCNGTSPQCPQPEAKRPVNGSSSLSCNGGSNYCVNGECTGSICVPLELPDCECTDGNSACHICCRLPNGTCSSTLTLARVNATARNLLPNRQGQVYTVGFPCSNFTGYCDFYNICRQVQKAGALKRLTDFLQGDQTIRTAINWITQYWWAAIIAGVLVLVVLFVIVLACHCILPRPEHMRKRIDRRRTIRRNQRQSKRGGRVKADYWMKTAQESRM